jgi:anti-sigma B factor antagonist
MEAFRIERQDDALLVNFSGEITLEITTELKGRIDEVIKGGDFKALVVNLSEITFMDSSGIGFLVAMNTKTMGLGKKMFLLKPSAQVRKTLDLVQLSNFFQTLDNEDELLTL